MYQADLIVAALAAGAAAGRKPTADQAVKDTYAGLKAFIQSKYPSINLEPLETEPESEEILRSTAKALRYARVGENDGLLKRAKALLDTVEQHDRQTAEDIIFIYKGFRITGAPLSDELLDWLKRVWHSISFEATGGDVHGEGDPPT